MQAEAPGLYDFPDKNSPQLICSFYIYILQTS